MALATADTASMITDADCEAFDRDGYLIKRRLFSDAEVELLQQALATDEALQDSAYGLDDGYGGQTIVAVWNHPGDDTLGIVGRLPRIAGAAAKLLYPNLVSVAVAVSELTEENGTMRVLRGSHLCGRLEHGIMGGQSGADMERVEHLSQYLEEVSFIAEPGDACFFHCNTLHTSAPNVSEANRDLLLCCYNRADNNPVVRHHHPYYTPLEVVDDGALLRTGLWSVGFERSFMDPAEDISIGEYEADPLA